MCLQEAQTGPVHMPCTEDFLVKIFHHFFHSKELQRQTTTNKQNPQGGRNQFKVSAAAIPILFMCSITAWSLRELVHGPELEENDSAERQSKAFHQLCVKFGPQEAQMSFSSSTQDMITKHSWDTEELLARTELLHRFYNRPLTRV